MKTNRPNRIQRAETKHAQAELAAREHKDRKAAKSGLRVLCAALRPNRSFCRRFSGQAAWDLAARPGREQAVECSARESNPNSAAFIPLPSIPLPSLLGRCWIAALSRCVLLWLMMLFAPNAPAQSFMGLGDLPGGRFESLALDVSYDGSVVVGQSEGVAGTEAIRWTRLGGMVGLGIPPGRTQSIASGVSDDGSVVVGTSSGAFSSEAFRWTGAEGMRPLAGIPAAVFLSLAESVSADGSVVVGYSEGGGWSGGDPFRWTVTGGYAALTNLPAGAFGGGARDVSADGRVVIGFLRIQLPNSWHIEALRWTSNTGLVRLGDLPGGDLWSQALATSGDGSVVVGFGESLLGTEAFRWTSDEGMVGLGDLPGGVFASAATSVSAGGSVAVGSGSTASGSVPIVWDSVNGMRNLWELLVNDYGLGAALAGWTLGSANAISGDGTTIVGYGKNPNGNIEAWIATIPRTVKPKTLYVWQDSPSPTPPYTNWASAAHVIQDAVDAAAPGDTVLVTNGVYATGGINSSRVYVNKPLHLLSVNGPEVTIIEGYQVPGTTNGVGAIRCMYLTNEASLTGFTLRSGATLRNMLGTGGHGGGLFCEATNVVVSNCVLLANSAWHGAGAYRGTLNNCTLIGNSAVWWGGGAKDSTLNNCALIRNSSSASHGGGAYSCTLNNCTVVRNTAKFIGGGAFQSTLNNCIVYFNTAAWPHEANYSVFSTLSHCCTTPLPAGPGHIAADPRLASNYRLGADSPCIGAGSPAHVTGTDIDGEPWANPPSIGCDELVAGSAVGPLSVAIAASYTNVATGYPVHLTALIEGEANVHVWRFGDGTVVSNQLQTSHAWSSAGDLDVVLTAYNQNYPTGISATVAVHVITQPVHYVAADNPNPVPPYLSWATAATDIQHAVDAAGTLPGTLVLVTNGNYSTGVRTVQGTNRVAISKPLILQSVNGPQLTVIDGARAVRCVYLTNGASISGFSLLSGDVYHITGANSAYGERGAGVFCESLSATVSNCIITANWPYDQHALMGAGAFGGTLINCVLSTNRASSSGGGAAEAILIGCVLVGNGAGSFGGGAYRSALLNCTIVGNWASTGDGVASSSLNNCIAFSNPSPYDGDAYYASVSSYTYTGDPLFVNLSGGNLRLQSNSPCINAGNNSAVLGSTDLDGRPRIRGGIVDMGAYEFPLNAAPVAVATASPTSAISPNGSNAVVTLDGSRSSDPDGDPLVYLWILLAPEPGEGGSSLLATGITASVQLPVGINVIALVVSDGLAASTNNTTVTVLTTAQAVERLMALVDESRHRHQRPLLATLEAALDSLERGSATAAANQLHAFQNQVRAQVSGQNPDLAKQLSEAAAQIIAALDGNEAGRLTAKFHELKRHPDGRTQLKFRAPPGRAYRVEASTNLVDWSPLGAATALGDGEFAFEDTHTARLPCRFYRVAVGN